eukprot:gene9898-biopygen18248
MGLRPGKKNVFLATLGKNPPGLLPASVPIPTASGTARTANLGLGPETGPTHQRGGNQAGGHRARMGGCGRGATEPATTCHTNQKKTLHKTCGPSAQAAAKKLTGPSAQAAVENTKWACGPGCSRTPRPSA